jgi:hypothetical protein
MIIKIDSTEIHVPEFIAVELTKKKNMGRRFFREFEK